MAIIRVPNGNKFLVDISIRRETADAGTSVIVEQRNLTIIDAITETAEGHGRPVRHHRQAERSPGARSAASRSRSTRSRSRGAAAEEARALPQGRHHADQGHPALRPARHRQDPARQGGSRRRPTARSSRSWAASSWQKFIGEGAKLVKDIFELARDHAPPSSSSDEIDALAAKRIRLQARRAEREVQRTFMQLLAEIDGFNNLGNVKIIGARPTAATSSTRPSCRRAAWTGLIEVPVPDRYGHLRENLPHPHHEDDHREEDEHRRGSSRS